MSFNHFDLWVEAKQKKESLKTEKNDNDQNSNLFEFAQPRSEQKTVGKVEKHQNGEGKKTTMKIMKKK